MQPYSNVTVQQLSDHLNELRLEAARSRLGFRQTDLPRPNLLGRTLRLLKLSAQPETDKPALKVQ